MILAGFAAFLLFAFGGGDKQMRPIPVPGGTVTVRQQIIIRGTVGVRSSPAEDMTNWREGHGPRCIAARNLLGAARLSQESVDLIFRDNTRVRARLERRCPALDYYRGFYLNPTDDGMICADRDAIHSRAGGECRIDRFRTLRAQR